MVVQSPQSLQSSVPSPKNGIKIHAETTGERRVSARLQAAKQKANDKMTKRKLELLDEDDGSRPKKRNARAQNQDRNRNRKRKRKREPEHVQTGNEQQQQPQMTSSSVSSVLVEPKMNKKVAKMVERAAKIAEGLDGNNAANFAEKSAHIKVKETLRLFNKHYLHFVQEEEKRCGPPGTDKKAKEARKKLQQANGAEDDGKAKAKRPDLKAMGKMTERNEVLHPESRIGNIPGIDVGFRFYSRAEMVVIGFHNHWLNGIDYMGGVHRKEVYKNYKFPLAVAIVISGMYEDDLDNADDVVYTGQGGHNLNGNKRQIKDQVLLRGNLALKNSMDLGVTVRVVRGHFCESSYTGKVYTYDGLYKVDKYWAEKGLSGFTVYKYLLKRLEGQPTLTTNQVQFTHGRVPQCSSEIRGLVCEDISGGLEGVPVPATNLVDDPPVPPTGYRYCKSMEVARNIKLPANAAGCNCEGGCWDPKTCACARLNGSNFPYVHRDGGRLIEAKHVVFECGPNCACGPRCVNRTSQRGLKYRLEVFRTPKKGWAVRSWNFIPAGAPVCEYIGVLKRTEEMDCVSENNYIFDIDCLQTMRGVGGRDRRQQDASLPVIQNMDKIDEQRSDSVPEFCIDAASIGNVARFINHSCEPNLFIQCVLSEHQDIKLARVMLFAADNIPPLQELTYDYGYALDSVHGPDGKVKQMACYCGAEGCRKRLF